MTKVIKGEIEKLEIQKIKDVSLACDISLDIFNEEFNRMSGMDDDLHMRGDDEVELIDEESFDSDDEDEVAEVFRIDTNIFNFETPICKAFKEFNYLLQIDPDLPTKDIEGFKTYEDFKDNWIYEWNKDVSWVHDKPWTETGVWTEPTPVVHRCKPFNYKTGCSECLPVAGEKMDIVIKGTY
ncbi:hypothetical protein Tco_1550263, partial [Tanacetum coccineum]